MTFCLNQLMLSSLVGPRLVGPRVHQRKKMSSQITHGP